MSLITIEHNPSQERLAELNVANWEIWEKEVSEFTIDFDETETAYVLEGEILVTPKGGALAYVLIDYGPEYDLLWQCFQDDTGESWTWNNKEIRAQKNKINLLKALQYCLVAVAGFFGLWLSVAILKFFLWNHFGHVCMTLLFAMLAATGLADDKKFGFWSSLCCPFGPTCSCAPTRLWQCCGPRAT